MRSFSKNKFLFCFRPVVDIDTMLESKVATHTSTNRGFPCIPVSDKHEMMKISPSKSVFSHRLSPKFSYSSIMQHPPKRTICRVIKAVVFDTILNRRTRHKSRHSNDSFGSKHSYSSYTETKTPQSPLSTSSSHGSSSSSSSSQVSQSKNVSMYYSTREKQRDGNRGGSQEKQKQFECYGIYLVLISLLFTVFWGKLFGIVLTSILLYFFSVCDSTHHCKKRLQTGTRQRQSVQGKDRGHYGRFAPRGTLP
ncbi:uncharacterized protein LOC133301169 [Gastrolobium bilobum]|uniref:uncharacterized protein LOC133301169 n=1 Tax=Gastrolobium bilobum TaxID=150636 RepID=UPI002AB205A8|nr:uncharacterized protein LOC133301169 [Gastrolobium bilobum]